MDKLRNMEVMVAVVEAGSFAAAARQLQISAVMVGKHIQQLEAHLGARLFQRSTRRSSLTEVGAAFYEDSKRVLEQVRWAESAVERSRAVPQGLLRLSAPFTLGNHVIAPLVADYQLANPLVRRVATESLAGGKESPAFGRVYGFVYSGLDVGLALGPLAFGLLLDAGGRDGVLPGVALLQILAVFTVLAMGRRVASPPLRSS